MTQTIAPSDEEVRDFTEHVRVMFKIDDDVFTGVTGIPVLDLLKFATTFDGLSAQDFANQPDAFRSMFQLVLEPASFETFYARMGDKTRPISMAQCMNILPWLMEKYGMRPTEPSPNSFTGSVNPGDGTSSTESAQLQVSTLDGLASIAS